MQLADITRRITRPDIWFAAFVLVGLAVRIAYVTLLPDSPLDPDERDYLEAACGLLSGTGFEQTVYYHVPPVAPLLFTAACTVKGCSYEAARLLQCLFFVPAALASYLMARELAGKLCGLLTVVFVSLYPYFIYFTGQVGTEALALVLAPAMLWASARAAAKPSAGRCLLFGLLLGLATLTRAAFLYFVLAIPLIFMISFGLRDLRWLRATSLAAAGFFVLYLPWSAVNRSYFGTWIPAPTIGAGVMLYQTGLRITMPDDNQRLDYLKREIFPKYYYPAGATHAERLAGDRYLAREGLRLIRENLKGYAAVVFDNFSRFWQFYPNAPEHSSHRGLYRIIGICTYGILFPFMLAGAVAGLGNFRRISAFYGFIAYLTLVHMLLYGKLRYRIPLDPLLLAFAALGFQCFLSRFAPGLLRGLQRRTGAGTEIRMV